MRTLTACAVLMILSGCHLLIDAEDHLAPVGVDGGGPRDSGMRDSGTRDSGMVDTGAPDSGPACLNDSTLCGPRGITGCTPSGCQTCAPRIIDAAPWLQVGGDSLDMATPVFDITVRNGGGAYMGLVAAGIGAAGAQRPRLAIVPLETSATPGTPPATDLNSAAGLTFDDIGEAAFASELDDEVFLQGSSSGALQRSVVGLRVDVGTFGISYVRPGPTTPASAGHVAQVTVPTDSPGTQNVFVWPSLSGATGSTSPVLNWLDQSGNSGQSMLPSTGFPGAVHVRGSRGSRALVQSLAPLRTTYIYRAPVGGMEQLDFVSLDAGGTVDWIRLGPKRYLAVVPTGSTVQLMSIDANDCSPNCAATRVGLLNYVGTVIAARIVELDQALAIATIAQAGTADRAVELRIVTREAYEPISSVFPIPDANTDDWLYELVGAQASQLALAPSPLFSTHLQFGIAWANDDGTGSSRLEARFLVFDGCGSE